MKTKAFTLIELLIVVAIIAILAAIAVPNFLEAQTRAKVSRAKADLRSLAIGAESYYVDNNAYPYTNSQGTSIWMPGGGPFNNTTIRAGGITSPIAYMTTIPEDVFKHAIDEPGGFKAAPIYMEKAGFGITNGVVLRNKPSRVPNDANGTLNGVSNTLDAKTTESETPRVWIMYSLGPDMTPFVTDRPVANGTVINGSRWTILNRYDPTNGTISTGNILRLPGGENFP
ncbi:prepilin-type N-terminal cleavage/methylation domain-containing protein [Candidatus Sumerlaeota bacterium]|nr:prepilin-type N-terminal cleavage/methylation domain-containing protein [Candidatus Sumerlaeota bacterium]